MEITIHNSIPFVTNHIFNRTKLYHYFDQNIFYAHCWLTYKHSTNWFLDIDLDERPNGVECKLVQNIKNLHLDQKV